MIDDEFCEKLISDIPSGARILLVLQRLVLFLFLCQYTHFQQERELFKFNLEQLIPRAQKLIKKSSFGNIAHLDFEIINTNIRTLTFTILSHFIREYFIRTYISYVI